MGHFHISHFLIFLPSVFSTFSFVPFQRGSFPTFPMPFLPAQPAARQQWQQELQKFWHSCSPLIPLTWVQGANLSCSALGKEAGLHCTGDECPGEIWPRVQETRWILLGWSSVSCPTGELCLDEVQEVLEKLSTCH